MQNKINLLVAETIEKINLATTKKELTDIKVEVMGKNGALTSFMRNMKDLPNDQKPLVGKFVNDARVQIEEVLNAKFTLLSQKELQEKLDAEKIDITIDKKDRKPGGIHPINIVRRKVVDFFTSMGFVNCFNSIVFA